MRPAALFLALLCAAPLLGATRRERERIAGEAKTAFERGDYEAAARGYAEAIAAGARRAERRKWQPWVGRSWEAARNYQKALAAYQDALDADPKSLGRQVDLARVYDTVELDDRALELYTRVLEKDRKRRDVILALGDLHLAGGRLWMARQFAERAVAQDPKDAAGQFLLSRVEEAGGDLPGAARRRESALMQSPTAEGYLALGRLWARQDAFDLADRAYRRAAQESPATPEVLFERGVLAWRRDQRDDAARFWSQAAGYFPSDILLAVQDWERGRPAKAAERLRRLSLPAESQALKFRDTLLLLIAGKE